jgi:hypothetical protein
MSDNTHTFLASVNQNVRTCPNQLNITAIWSYLALALCVVRRHGANIEFFWLRSLDLDVGLIYSSQITIQALGVSNLKAFARFHNL